MARLIILAAAAALLGPWQAASSQDEKTKRLDPAELFARLDKNSDGVLTEDEVAADAKPFFARVVREGDKNGDGKLSKAEFIAGLESGKGERRKTEPGEKSTPAEKSAPPKDFNPEALFARLDRNGDGKVSKDELPERGRELFERLDANKDGDITKEEFKAGAPKLPRPAAAAPGGDGALFRALDTSGDGRISAEEMSRAAEVLKKLDRNGDGAITREELGPPPSTSPTSPSPTSSSPKSSSLSGRILERLKQADKNGDGKLSKDEAPDRLQENFDRIDANKDGYLDAAELRAAFEELRKKAEKFKEPKPE